LGGVGDDCGIQTTRVTSPAAESAGCEARLLLLVLGCGLRVLGTRGARSDLEVESASRFGGPVTVLERVRVRERRVRLTPLETLELLDTERADWGRFGMEMLVSGDEESMLKAA